MHSVRRNRLNSVGATVRDNAISFHSWNMVPAPIHSNKKIIGKLSEGFGSLRTLPTFDHGWSCARLVVCLSVVMYTERW